VKHHQRGAAILLAMLVVTLVATLAAGLQWRQWRAFSQESAARAQSQAGWVLVGALDWSRLILREDSRASQNSPVDHLAEPWAIPLKEAKLSTFLSTDNLVEPGQDEVFLSGSITDAQAKLNLTNLMEGDKLSQLELAKLGKLYTQLGLPLSELNAWSLEWVLSQSPKNNSRTNTAGQSNAQSTPASAPASAPISGFLQPQKIQDLEWLGVSKESLQALEPFITILPQKTPINLNTASALVIYAAVAGLDLSVAQRWVTERAQKPLRNLSDAASLLGLPSSGLTTKDVDVQTSFFQVQGRLRQGDWLIGEQSLVQRTGQDVKTVWRNRLF
jgi:general secretion pathway protein K